MAQDIEYMIALTHSIVIGEHMLTAVLAHEASTQRIIAVADGVEITKYILFVGKRLTIGRLMVRLSTSLHDIPVLNTVDHLVLSQSHSIYRQEIPILSHITLMAVTGRLADRQNIMAIISFCQTRNRQGQAIHSRDGVHLPEIRRLTIILEQPIQATQI